MLGRCTPVLLWSIRKVTWNQCKCLIIKNGGMLYSNKHYTSRKNILCGKYRNNPDSAILFSHTHTQFVSVHQKVTLYLESCIKAPLFLILVYFPILASWINKEKVFLRNWNLHQSHRCPLGKWILWNPFLNSSFHCCLSCLSKQWNGMLLSDFISSAYYMHAHSKL